jgi:hypothetical protein
VHLLDTDNSKADRDHHVLQLGEVDRSPQRLLLKLRSPTLPLMNFLAKRIWTALQASR